MAKKMSKLDLCWKNCMSMWAWVAKWKKASLRRRKDIEALKKQWLDAHGFDSDSIEAYCFFCEYANRQGGGWPGCSKCPAKEIDLDFECQDSDYDYEQYPIAFYNKLRALNRERLKKVK